MRGERWQAGVTIADRFILERAAGEGGMGVVFEARDIATGGVVALKLVHATDSTDVPRFQREAEILSHLDHPGIVGYVDHGPCDGGFFLAMEWLEGEDLAQRIQREPLSESSSLEMVGTVASILAAAHAQGVVHRDLKPSNLFLVDRDPRRVKVLDFGIARLTASERRTQTGAVLGTPAYMAPEQAAGASTVDVRADIFALGVVLFECLTTSLPFEGSDPIAILANVLLTEAPRLRSRLHDASEELDDLVASMLHKKPEERPPSCAHLAHRLRSVERSPSSLRSRSSEPPAALTQTEQRLLSTLVMRPIAVSEVAATMAASGQARSERILLANALAPYGARVHHLVDGSLVAIVSGNNPATDQAARIARAALVARTILPDHRMAVATGRGVAGRRAPMGDALDDAFAMLEDETHPRIVVDEATASLLGPGFALRDDGHSAELVAEKRDADSDRLLLGKSVPCVGRRREIATALATLEACIEDGGSQVVVLTSEAGMGKSRLRREIVSRAIEHHDVLVWMARGDPLTANSPFGMLAPMLRRAAGIRDGDALEVRRRGAAERMREILPADTRDETIALLCALMGIPLEDGGSVALAEAREDPVLLGDQMRRAWEELVMATTAHSPVLLVLEDLQWGDRPTIQFVEAALRAARDRPLMVLVSSRLEGRERFVETFARHGAIEIRLKPLSKKASERLVRHALGDTRSAGEVSLIVERAQGHAFFLEELIRAAASRTMHTLPSSVMAMLQSRLDALAPEARQVLRAASVFGRVFWHRGVEALLGGARRSTWVEPWVEPLIRAELIQRRPTCRYPGETELSFRNQLVRDAAYAMLTPEDLVVGHRLAAAFLEAVGESDSIVLARHFENGGRVDRARDALARGAAHALGGHDFQSAIDRAQRALDHRAVGEPRGLLLRVVAEAQCWLGHFDAARLAADEALALLPVGSRDWFQVMGDLFTALGRLSRFDEASTRCAEMANVRADDDAIDAQVTCLCGASRVLFQAGAYVMAESLLRRVTQIVSSANVGPRARAQTHRLRGARARHFGDIVGDFEGYRAAEENFTRADDERNACNAGVSVGFAYIELGAFDDARTTLDTATRAATRLGLSSVVTRARQNLALLHALEGNLDEARALADAVVEESVAKGNVRFEGWTRIYLSRIAFMAKDFEDALAQAERAIALVAHTPPARAGAMAAAARALTALGRHREAHVLAFAATTLLEHLGGLEEFGPLIRVATVETLIASGQHRDARTSVENALRRIEATATRLDDARLARAYVDRAPDHRALRQLAAKLMPSAAHPRHQRLADG